MFSFSYSFVSAKLIEFLLHKFQQFLGENVMNWWLSIEMSKQVIFALVNKMVAAQLIRWLASRHLKHSSSSSDITPPISVYFFPLSFKAANRTLAQTEKAPKSHVDMTGVCECENAMQPEIPFRCVLSSLHLQHSHNHIDDLPSYAACWPTGAKSFRWNSKLFWDASHARFVLCNEERSKMRFRSWETWSHLEMPGSELRSTNEHTSSVRHCGWWGILWQAGDEPMRLIPGPGNEKLMDQFNWTLARRQPPNELDSDLIVTYR